MSYTRTILDPALKIKYDAAAVAIFNEEMKAKDRFAKGSSGALRGKYLYLPMVISRNPTGTFGNETSLFPVAGNTAWDHVELVPTYGRNTTKWTHRAQDDSAEGQLAFASAIEQAYKDGPTGIARQLCLSMISGRFNCRAVCGIDHIDPGPIEVPHNGAGQFTVRNAFVGAALDQWGTRVLLENQALQIVDPLTGAVRVNAGGASVFYLSARLTTSTFTGTLLPNGAGGAFIPVGAVAGDYIVPADSFHWGSASANDPVGDGLFGFDELFDDGTYVPARLFNNFGVNFDRSAQPLLDSVVMNLAGADLAEVSLENFLDAIGAKCGIRLDEMNRGVFWCRRETMNHIKKFKYGDVRYTPSNAAELGVAAKGLTFSHGEDPISFEPDPKMIPGTLFAINSQEMEWFENQAIKAVDEDNGGPVRLVRDVTTGQYLDQFEILWRWRGQFFCRRPHTGGKLLNFGTGSYTSEFGMGSSFLPIV